MATRKTSGFFRRALHRELPAWQQEGLITEQQASALSGRYELDKLKAESSGALVTAIYIIGAVLIAAGAVSFVTANWDEMNKWVKVALIVGAMLACHAVGFWLWKFSGKKPLLGHALVTLGTLLFGVNIALLAQIFHIHSNFYNGFGACAIGALVMAYALGSTPNALIALIASFVWFCGWYDDLTPVFNYYPFLAAALFLPYAYLRRSVWVFTAALLAIGITLPIFGKIRTDWPAIWLLGILGLGQLYYGWGLMSAGTKRFGAFAHPARGFGYAALLGIAYAFSFLDLAEELRRLFMDIQPEWQWIVPLAATWAAAIVCWVLSCTIFKREKPDRVIEIATWLAVILMLATIGYVSDVVTVVAANVALLVLASGLLWRSVSRQERLSFWVGVAIVALLIVSRFFEYDFNLLIKAAAFLACGVGVIFAGVVFEKFVRKQEPAHAKG